MADILDQLLRLDPLVRDIAFEVEDELHEGLPIARRGMHLLDATHGGKGLFHRTRDVLLHLVRGGVGVGNGEADERYLHLRE